MLGNGRLADTEWCAEFSRWAFPRGKQIENTAPRCIRDHMKNVRAGGNPMHLSYDITNWLCSQAGTSAACVVRADASVALGNQNTTACFLQGQHILGRLPKWIPKHFAPWL